MQNILPNIRSFINHYSQVFWFIIIFVIALISSFGVYSLIIKNPTLFTNLKNKILVIFKKTLNKDPNIWTPSSNSIETVLSGRQQYNITGGTEGLPQIVSVILDPQDPKKGGLQNIYVATKNATAVKEVIAVLHLDNNKEFEYQLSLVEGTNLDGIWKKTLEFPGTFNNTYRVTVKARNENNLGNMSTITIK